MAIFTIQSNQFNFDQQTSRISPHNTIRAWVDELFPKTREFPFTTVSLVNGEPVLRKEWVNELSDEDEVLFVVEPGYEIGVFLVILFIGAAAYAISSIPGITSPNDIGDPNPVYSLSGQSNQNRLNSEIEDPYGLNRLWPSRAAESYKVFRNNEQYVFILLCLGQGEYDLPNAVVQIEDTEISNFQDITYEFYEPGEDVTLFPDNVETSGEVGSTELEHTVTIGPFAANSAGTVTNRLEVDISFVQGLGFADDDGAFQPVTVDVHVEYQVIDDLGTPIGGWLTFVNFSKTLATNDITTFTETLLVAAARFQIRMTRTSAEEADTTLQHRTQEQVNWVGMRAFLPSTKDYGDVTLLAIEARATNNLNDSSSNRVNVVCTRNLPIYNGTVWSAPQPTRSLVWASCNVLRAKYNHFLDDQYIDLTALVALNTELEADGHTFDHVYDRQANVWARLEEICAAGLCLPTIQGSQVTIVKDEIQTIPKGVYTKENIIDGTFTMAYKMFTDDDTDGVEMEYTDPVSYKREVVACPGPILGDSPKVVRSVGVQDRTRAWRIGMRIYEQLRRRRLAIGFSTGLEGNIPGFNDMVKASHEVFPEGSLSGRVLSYVNIGGDQNRITLDTELDFTGGPHSIIFRGITGDEVGPIVVTQDTSLFTIVVTDTQLGGPIATILPISDEREPPFFIFGETDEVARNCRVIDISPTTGEAVAFETVEDDDVIYSHDAEFPPVLPPSGGIPTLPNDLPEVVELFVRDIPGRASFALASWNAVEGAVYYLLMISQDGGTTYTFLGTPQGTSLEFPVQPGNYFIRVAAMNAGQGPWVYWNGELGDTSGISNSGVLIDGGKLSASVPIPSVGPQSLVFEAGEAFGLVADPAINVQIDANSFTKIAGGNTANTRVYSTNSHTGDAFASFRPFNNTMFTWLGFNVGAPQPVGGAIDYLWGPNSSGFAHVYILSVDTANVAYNSGDVFSIIYTGTSIEFRHNGNLIHTEAVSAGLEMFLGCTLSQQGAGMEDIVFGVSEANPGFVTVSADVPSGTIYYTVDGSPVSAASPLWNGDVLIDDTTKFRFRTLSATGIWSQEVQRSYTASTPSTAQVAAPSFAPTFGNGVAGSVTIASGTAGADIFYEVVAGFPTSPPGGWSLYSGPVAYPSGTQTVWAYAARSGLNDSSPVPFISS